MYRSSSSTDGHLQVIIPEALKGVVLQQLHNQSGHLRFHKTLQKIKERFYWPGYESDTATWIQECQACQKRNQPQPAQQAPLEAVTSNRPFKKLSWDIMGPLPVTSNGNKYMVVITDIFSKWVEAFPIQSTDTETLATLLVNDVICRYGTPSCLHSDQGTNLISNLMAAVCNLLGIKQSHTSSYHPQGNGQIERLNRTLEAMLAKVVSDHQRYWDTHLPRVLFAYRTAIHESTGFSPFHVTFGRSPVLPIEVFMGCSQQPKRTIPSFVAKIHQSLHTAYATVRQRITAAHKRNKNRYDKQKPFSPFQVGDQVWLFTPVVKPGTTKKFTSQWRGPYTVLDRVNRVNYRIKLVGSSAKSQVIHHNRLKLCYGTPQQTTTSMQHQSSTVRTQPLYADVVRRPALSVGGYTSPPCSSATAPMNSATTSSNNANMAPPSSSIDSVTATLVRSANPCPQRNRRPPARYNDFIASKLVRTQYFRGE